MEKKRETPSVQELRDQPVPPVKGVITEGSDAIRRPDIMLQADARRSLEDSAMFDSWL